MLQACGLGSSQGGGLRFSACVIPLVPDGWGGVNNTLVISYISWGWITLVIRLIAFRADIISARALGKLL